MRSSKIRWSVKSPLSAWLIGCFMMMAPATGAWAQDDWRPRNGLEGLRPLKSIEPMVTFLQAQQTEIPEPAPLLPTPTDPESYLDWLDEAEQKGVPRVREGRFVLPPLSAPILAMTQIGNGRIPEGFRYDDPSPIIPLPETSAYRGSPSWTTAYWAAANTYSNPRYFEERMLERHGHERCPALTPVISGARFFTTVAMLPYLSVLSHPCRPESTLGYYRAGSAAPAMCQRPPLDARAALVEAAAIAGFVLLVP